MRMTSFLLPITHSRGAAHDPAHQEVRGRLLRTFGGFTASDCSGAWQDDTTHLTHYDKSIRYEVAAEWTDENMNKLIAIAKDGGLLAHQTCVLLTWPDGEVEFLDTTPTPA